MAKRQSHTVGPAVTVSNVVPSSSTSVEALLLDYATRRPNYEALGPKLEELMRQLLANKGVRYHTVTHRVKEVESLRNKLSRANTHYSGLDEVPDLLGMRVTTYLPDEVNVVARILGTEFHASNEVIDKGADLDPDRFGYLSVHFLGTLGPKRRRLPEWKRFADLKFEVQARSILQHAWAEIEHDLGYKSQTAIPRTLRRRFSRLAALLEVADSEFAAIRDDLAKYQKEVARTVTSAPDSTLIDATSVAAFIRRNRLVRELDKSLAEYGGASIDQKKDRSSDSSDELHAAGLKTIGELETELSRFHDRVMPFVREWVPANNYQASGLRAGHSLFFLCYLIVAARGSVARAEKYLTDANIAGGQERQVALRMVRVFRKISGLGGAKTRPKRRPTK